MEYLRLNVTVQDGSESKSTLKMIEEEGFITRANMMKYPIGVTANSRD